MTKTFIAVDTEGNIVANFAGDEAKIKKNGCYKGCELIEIPNDNTVGTNEQLDWYDKKTWKRNAKYHAYLQARKRQEEEAAIEESKRLENKRLEYERQLAEKHEAETRAAKESFEKQEKELAERLEAQRIEWEEAMIEKLKKQEQTLQERMIQENLTITGIQANQSIPII